METKKPIELNTDIVRWTIIVNHNNKPETYKRYAKTEEEVRSILEEQLKQFYPDDKCDIYRIEKDKTHPI